MDILVIDIGGTNVKIWKTGEADKVKVPSGKQLNASGLVKLVREHTADWSFDRVSVGYPGRVLNGRPAEDPYNLAPGWVNFDFVSHFGCPVRIMNDACMQALGSYEGGTMLYLGLGTSVGVTLIADGKIVPLALGHLQFSDHSFEHYLSRQGLEHYGVKKWRKQVSDAAGVLKAAFLADYVVLGGGNAKKIKDAPEGCRLGGNHNAYFGGIRMWEDAYQFNAPLLSIFPQGPAQAQ
jgi:polyphosphate glucokinase